MERLAVTMGAVRGVAAGLGITAVSEVDAAEQAAARVAKGPRTGLGARLFEVCAGGSAAEVAALLAEGADPAELHPCWTPPPPAGGRRWFSLLRLDAAPGVVSDAPAGLLGITPYLAACARGALDVVRLLRRGGAYRAAHSHRRRY
jgi:hypothetical protein